MRDRNRAARAAFGGLLVALAFLFGYVEMLIPINLGVPGIKLGLANLVTIAAIFLLGVPEAAAVTIIRVILTGFTFGNLSMMMYSMAGALTSLAVMAAVKRTDLFGITGVSICGGVSHNLGQLFCAMAEHFPGGVLAFDSCNERGAKLMRKTWLKEAGITDVSAFFSLENESALAGWSDRFASVTAKSYMRGYRDIYSSVGLFHKLMIRFCDGLVRMKIVRIVFGG